MSNTPIIDKLVSDCEHLPIVANNRIWAVARELERESDSLRAELEMAMAEQEQLLGENAELKKLVEQMKDALLACEEKICHGVWSDHDNPIAMNMLLGALEAAKGGK